MATITTDERRGTIVVETGPDGGIAVSVGRSGVYVAAILTLAEAQALRASISAVLARARRRALAQDGPRC